jgi:hypothetical protein
MSGNLSIAKCLSDAVAAGRLSAAAAQDAQKRLEAKMLAEGIQPGTAAAAVAEEMALAAANKRRQAALRVIRGAANTATAAAHPRGFAAGVAAIFARDIYGLLGSVGIEGRWRAIKGEAHARFVTAMDAFRSKNLGLSRDLPGLREVVREHYQRGVTGNATARQAADAWADTEGFLAKRFNQAGGNLPERPGYFPQVWDNARVKAEGKAEWTRWMRNEYSAGRLNIRSFETGQRLPTTLAHRIIDEAYERIASDGMSDLVPGQFKGSSNLAERHNTARVFEWTSADAWLGFNDRFGMGDAGIYDLLTGHIDGRSRDIAMLEILGPNPGNEARRLIDEARKRGEAPYIAWKLEAIWDHVSGAANSPVSEWLAGTMRGVRAWLTAARLGSATLSAVTDFGTLRNTAAWNGMHATSVMQRYLSLLNPGNAGDRRLAVRLGLIADGWATRAAGAMRDQADIVGSDLAGRVADTVLRSSGLSAHTQAGKWAFGMEFLGELADQAGKRIDQLDPRMQAAFQRYGIDAGDWDIIRRTGLWQEDGATFIMPEQIVRGPNAGTVPSAAALAPYAPEARQRAASRLLEMVQTETNFAIVEPGALERAIVVGSHRPGTLAGEFLRSSMQFKTFPVSMMTRHMMRGIEGVRGGDRGKYLAVTAVSLTVFGAMAMQLKAIAQGKDPRDMTAPTFWPAAFVQGGGAGLFGDFFSGALSRSDRSFYLSFVGGPTAGLVDDFARLTGGNIQGLSEGKDTNAGRELARFVQTNAPGTSLWYARLALDRLMWDRLHEQMDPDHQRRFLRMEDRARRELNQEFWWRPGSTSPTRAPSANAAIGGRPE